MKPELIGKILVWLGVGLIAYFFLKLIMGMFRGNSTANNSLSTTGSASAFSPFSSLWNTVPTVTPASQTNNTANLIAAGGSAFSNVLTSFGKLFNGSSPASPTVTGQTASSITIPQDSYDWSAPNYIWDNASGTYFDASEYNY